MTTNHNNLKAAIVKTLAFFDVFDYPLTVHEIHKWLFMPDGDYTITNILEALDFGELQKKIQCEDGFYFLSGRQTIIETRRRRYLVAEKKYRIALRAASIIRFLAYVDMIAVCNNSGYSNARPQSDIDFFILVRSGRIWWTRLMVTIVVNALGLRRHGTSISNRVCLSFYLSSSKKNISDLAKTPLDPYFFYWLVTLVPLYNINVYKSFFDDNIWVKKYIPNARHYLTTQMRSVPDTKMNMWYRRLDEAVMNTSVGNVLNKISRFIQQKKMEHNIHSAATEPNTNVIINDDMLKFHENDRRELYRHEWQERVSQYM